VWVFEQQERVRLNAGFYCQFGLFLDCEGGFVVDEPEALDQKLSFVHKIMQPDRGLPASF
jgi:hypothetical protein